MSRKAAPAPATTAQADAPQTDATSAGPLPEASSSSLSPESLPPSGAAPDGGTFTVICHHAGGRRRGGRRWPEGETPVAAGELTEFALEQLRGDPRFTVILPELTGLREED